MTALNLYPEVIRVAARNAATMGATGHVTFCTGDLLSAELETDYYDIVYFGGILYLFRLVQIMDILKRSYRVLKPGGGIVVINSLIADEERHQAEGPLIQAFRRWIYTKGDVGTCSEHRRALEGAGFSGVILHTNSLMSARKL